MMTHITEVSMLYDRTWYVFSGAYLNYGTDMPAPIKPFEMIARAGQLDHFSGVSVDACGPAEVQGFILGNVNLGETRLEFTKLYDRNRCLPGIPEQPARFDLGFIRQNFFFGDWGVMQGEQLVTYGAACVTVAPWHNLMRLNEDLVVYMREYANQNALFGESVRQLLAAGF